MSDTSSSLIHYAVLGDLTSTTAKAVREGIEQALATSSVKPGPGVILELGLREACFVDSVGINLLVLMIRKMKEQGGQVRIQISNPNVKRVLTFMRVDQHAEIQLF